MPTPSLVRDAEILLSVSVEDGKLSARRTSTPVRYVIIKTINGAVKFVRQIRFVSLKAGQRRLLRSLERLFLELQSIHLPEIKR